MGTRSVVGYKTPTGFKGVYVHWDGYPEHMMTALYELLRRDGYEHVCRVLVEEHPNGWSSIDPFEEEEDPDKWASHIRPLKYWGRFYQEDIVDHYFYDLEEARESWCEYAYIISANDGEPVTIHPYDLMNAFNTIDKVEVLCDHAYDSYCANCGVN